MNRIFVWFAFAAVLALLATFVVGLLVGDLHHDPSVESRRWFTVHFLSGVASALVVVLVNSIVVTYFIGTSRWCKEVCETYRLDSKLIQRSTVLKRKTFPWAVVGMLTVVGIISLGGASDPATGRPGTEAWVNWHFAGALTGMMLIVWAFFNEWQNIVANNQVITDVLAEVHRVRQERGLDTELPVAGG